MSTGWPTSYDEIVTVLGDLPMLVREKRRRNGLSLREAARQVGVSFSTLDRFEKGEDAQLRATVIPMLWWVSS